MTRRGFTLIEVLVAIVLAGVVALLVWGVGRAAVDGRERVLHAQHAARTSATFRALLADALRHAVAPAAGGDSPLVIADASGATGQPRDHLTFLTDGGLVPLTAELEWTVTVAVVGDDLELRAVPSLPNGTVVTVRVRGVNGLDVTALDGDGIWRSEWADADLPRAIAVVPRAGSRSIPALVAALPTVDRVSR